MKLTSRKGTTNLLVAAVLAFFIYGEARAQSRTFVTHGLFNTRQANLTERRVPLSGDWDYYPNKLLQPDQLRHHRRTALMVPALWDDRTGMTNTGFGTYSLALILPRTSAKWALEIPQLYNSYALYINDSLYAVNGRPAATKDSSALQWKPQFVTFSSKQDTTRIVLQLSNFHHFKGGIREPIFLGAAAVVERHFSLSMISVWIEVAIVCILSVLFVSIYFKIRKIITLYFAMLCIAWATRELFSDIYPISSVFPDINWFFLVRTEYITLFLITIFGLLFISQLYREFASDVFKYLVVLICMVYIAFVLVTPVIVFSRWLPLYLITAVVTLIYAAILIVRAMLMDKRGAWFLTAGLIVSLVTIGYDLIAYEAALSHNATVRSICYILIYLACAVGLLQHLRIIRSKGNRSNTLRYQDLYR